MCALAPYTIPNFFIEAYDVVVNKPKVAAYRAPGSPMAAFATESLIDEIATTLGIDPVEMRLKNAVNEGRPGAVRSEVRADRLAGGARGGSRSSAHWKSAARRRNRTRRWPAASGSTPA